MAAQATILNDMSNAARAAEGAAEAARALREAADRPRSSFSEASKVLSVQSFRRCNCGRRSEQFT